jgi:hypothetical protein
MSGTGNTKRMRSIEAVRFIRAKAPVKGSELSVLVALAEHCDSNFECHPGARRLAEMTRLSERHTVRVLHSLRRKGLIAFDDNHGGYKRSNHYRLLLNPDNHDIQSSDNSDKRSTKSLTSAPNTLTSATHNSDTAMSEEWVEGFGIENLESYGPNPGFKPIEEVLREVEQLEKNLEQVVSLINVGSPVIGNAFCKEEGHGAFQLHGKRFGSWILGRDIRKH